MRESREKTATGTRGLTARRRHNSRRFVRDARRAASCYGSGTFWYSIWRGFRLA